MVKKKIKIAILGMGGVGGYIGGMLAAHFHASAKVEIIFIARGESLEVIRERGLTLVTNEKEIVARPDNISDKPDEIGKIDLLICCVKSYDLEKSLHVFKHCITDKTIILPLLNGIDAAERIAKLYPLAEIWEACIYIVSKQTAPGFVKQSGELKQLYFGSSKGLTARMNEISNFFNDAGIDSAVAEDISSVIWRKFLFISPLASLTSALDVNIGTIVSNPDYKQTLLGLINELTAIALAKGIILTRQDVNNTIERFLKLPHDSTTSMHNDFKKGNKAEVDSLTGMVVKIGQDLKIDTPLYDGLLEKLKTKIDISTIRTQKQLQ